MRELLMYETDDGKLFRNEMEALSWEHQQTKLKIANQRILDGENLYTILSDLDMHSGTVEKNKDILLEMTKDTGVIITHWQCSNEACYKISYIDENGNLFIYGNPNRRDGYGSKVRLSEFCEYRIKTLMYENDNNLNV